MEWFELDSYDYDLPEELIARKPVCPRDDSRILCLNRESRQVVCDKKFADLDEILDANTVIVRNKTKVFPAKVEMKKISTDNLVEVFFVSHIADTKWEILLRGMKRLRQGDKLQIEKYIVNVLGDDSEGRKVVDVGMEKEAWLNVLEKFGKMPLPPYMKRKAGEIDRNNYQTIFAKDIGSVAAPTAGLHFTKDLDDRLKKKGIDILEAILHVGLGTFLPVRENDIRNHTMHYEDLFISEAVAKKLNKYKKDGKKILAVGTTTARLLESMTDENGILKSGQCKTNIFIYPGYHFRFVDQMITNFHLPKSSLLMMISAFVGDKGEWKNQEEMIDFLKSVYKKAIEEKYRFYSYGDGMWIG